MAKDRNNAVVAYLADDATYRAWWDAIRAQMTAVGLVQTADTGQLTPASHTRPAAGSYSGYEVWRFADTLQATSPIYLRIRPGTSPSAQDRPRIELTVGTSTNGAGTITGQAGTATTVVPNSSKTAGATLPSLMSHGEGYWHFVTNLDVSSASFGVGFVVERAINTGDPTANGIMTMALSPSLSGSQKQVIPPSGTVPGQVSWNSHPWPDVTTNGQNSSAGAGFAMLPYMYSAEARGHFTYLLHYNRTDLTADLVELDGVSNPKVDIWGENWSYMAIGDGLTALTQGTGNSIAIRWE